MAKGTWKGRFILAEQDDKQGGPPFREEEGLKKWRTQWKKILWKRVLGKGYTIPISSEIISHTSASFVLEGSNCITPSIEGPFSTTIVPMSLATQILMLYQMSPNVVSLLLLQMNCHPR